MFQKGLPISLMANVGEVFVIKLLSFDSDYFQGVSFKRHARFYKFVVQVR